MDLKITTVEKFIDHTASKAPTPGGGAIAAITGATAIALAEMVANLTIDKSGYETVTSDMKELQKKASTMRSRFLALAEEDMKVFSNFMSALQLPKHTDKEKIARIEAIQNCYKNAALVPLEIGVLAVDIFPLAQQAIEKGNKNTVTDAAIAAINARAAVKSAFLNVKINLASIKDTLFVEELKSTMNAIESLVDEQEEAIISACQL